MQMENQDDHFFPKHVGCDHFFNESCNVKFTVFFWANYLYAIRVKRLLWYYTITFPGKWFVNHSLSGVALCGQDQSCNNCRIRI